MLRLHLALVLLEKISKLFNRNRSHYSSPSMSVKPYMSSLASPFPAVPSAAVPSAPFLVVAAGKPGFRVFLPRERSLCLGGGEVVGGGGTKRGGDLRTASTTGCWPAWFRSATD